MVRRRRSAVITPEQSDNRSPQHPHSGHAILGTFPPEAWGKVFDPDPDVKLALQGVKAGACHLALRVANPLPKGMPVRFANDTQDQHAFGWLPLLPVEWK